LDCPGAARWWYSNGACLSSGDSSITALWISAGIVNMLSSGFSAHHRSKASFFRHENAFLTLSIGGCWRLVTLIQSGERPVG
jgi:hypothetical protein